MLAQARSAPVLSPADLARCTPSVRLHSTFSVLLCLVNGKLGRALEALITLVTPIPHDLVLLNGDAHENKTLLLSLLVR